MARSDWASNFALLLLGGAFAIASLKLNFGTVHRPGPGFLPFWTASGLILVASFSLARGLLESQRRKSGAGERLFDRSVLDVIATIVILAAYAVGLEWLGYNLSTFVLLIFLFKGGGFRRRSYRESSLIFISRPLSLAFMVLGAITVVSSFMPVFRRHLR